jgi:hypothetical protein
MSGTARRFDSPGHLIALANGAVTSMHDGFAPAAPLEKISGLLHGRALGRVMRMGRVSSWLNDIPRSIRAWDDVCLVRSAHGNSIPSHWDEEHARNMLATSPANAL